MMAFEISVNGRHVATIGIGEAGEFGVNVNWIAGEHRRGGPRLYAGGLAFPTQEFVSWPMPPIALGDEVAIKAVETEDITPGAEREPLNGRGPLGRGSRP